MGRYVEAGGGRPAVDLHTELFVDIQITIIPTLIAFGTGEIEEFAIS